MPAKKKDRRQTDRYKYPANARKQGRFSFGYKKGYRRIRHAEIYDISREGVSFRIDENYAPELGELIAVEFQLPNAKSMAWYAKVVRAEIEYIEEKKDEFTQVLRIASVFIELPELRKRQLGNLIDDLASRISKSDGSSRISILSQALTVRRRHDVTLWKYARAILIFAVSMFLAFEFISYMSAIGSRYERGSGPAIWQHNGHTPFEDIQTPPTTTGKHKNTRKK